jgi:exodeoxyribonuclease V beta subunit
VQYEILDRIYADPAATLLVIGDPKQAIYSFRGADLFAYLRAARDVGREALTLDVCYRADPRLVAAVNRLFARRPAPFLLEDVRYRPVAPRPDATERLATPGGDHGAMELVVLGAAGGGGSAARRRGGAASDVPAAAAAEVVRWLGAGATIDGAPLGAGDVAVLTRTNEEAERVQRELRGAACLRCSTGTGASSTPRRRSRCRWSSARSPPRRGASASAPRWRRGWSAWTAASSGASPPTRRPGRGGSSASSGGTSGGARAASATPSARSSTSSTSSRACWVSRVASGASPTSSTSGSC